MIRLEGEKLVKFLYQHQNTNDFQKVIHKIKHHKKYKSFSIDDIYVFLLVFAPNTIKSKRNNKEEPEIINKYLREIFIGILSKAPKLTTKNFALPSNIPFLFISKTKISKNNFEIAFDEDHQTLFLTSLPVKNNSNKLHPLLNGIKNIAINSLEYQTKYAETILNCVTPYSAILLKKHKICTSLSDNIFYSINKRAICFQKNIDFTFCSALYLARIKGNSNCINEYILSKIKNQNLYIENKKVDLLNDKNLVDLLLKTKIFNKIKESTFYNFNQNSKLNAFENIYEWFPKQTIINKNISISEHLNSLNCLDLFLNAKSFFNMQEYNPYSSDKSEVNFFKIIKNKNFSDYFFDNHPLIYEMISLNHNEKDILKIIQNDKIRNSLNKFFYDMDTYLQTDKKDFLLFKLLEICIQKNIWCPNKSQLIIMKDYFEKIEKRKSDLLFINFNVSNNILSIVNKLLFQEELEEFIPKINCISTKKILKH